jgi:hypothetical protein
MSLTLTKVPDSTQNAGVSQVETIYQVQPGAADYPAGGYVIPGALATGTSVIGKLDGEFVYSADIASSNLAGAGFDAYFVFPSGSFGAVPQPSQTVTMIVTIPNAAPGTALGLSPLTAVKSTTVGVTSNVLTVAIANSLKVGQFIYLSGFTAGGAINGMICQVATASATGFTANLQTPNITALTADTTGQFQLVQAGTGNLLTTGAVAAITNSLSTSSLLTMTCANTFVPGQFVIINGLTNGATANGVIAQILTASSTQFTANWTGTSFTTAADTGTASLLVTAGGAPVTTSTAFSITNSLATASSAGTAGLVTLTANNSLSPGALVVIQGLTNGAGVNGDVLTVLNSASLTAKIFTANYKNAGFTTAADTGVASQLVTGIPTSAPQVSPGTDLSACTWFLSIVQSGL